MAETLLAVPRSHPVKFKKKCDTCGSNSEKWETSEQNINSNIK